MKYRSLTNIYFMWSIFVCHTDPLYQVYLYPSNSLKSKSLDNEIQVTDPHLFHEANLYVTLIHYPKYNIPPSNSLQYITQNHWTTKNRSRTYIYYMVNLCVTLIHYVKCDLRLSNCLQDMRQNHWTMKYRSLTYIYYMMSIFVSH